MVLMRIIMNISLYFLFSHFRLPRAHYVLESPGRFNKVYSHRQRRKATFPPSYAAYTQLYIAVADSLFPPLTVDGTSGGEKSNPDVAMS